MDWNNDGNTDLVVSDTTARIWYALNTPVGGVPTFGPLQPVSYTSGGQVTNPDSGKATQWVVDWNNDGKKDIITGGEDDFTSGTGRCYFFGNTGTDAVPTFASPVAIGGGTDFGWRTSPVTLDWDGDGKKDVITSSVYGDVKFFRNTGTDAAPAFAANHNTAPFVATQSGNLSWGMETRIRLVDWDADTRPDLLIGDRTGQVRLYLRNHPPAANAGSDQVVTAGVAAVLDGVSTTDPENDARSYVWAFDAKPAGSSATISNATSASASFMPDLPGTYQLRLTVGDGHGPAVTDTCTVSVAAPMPPDLSWNSLIAPASVEAGQTLAVTRNYQVSASAVAPDVGIQYHLSTNPVWGDSDDIVLASEEAITALVDKAVGPHSGSFSVTVPVASAAGGYYLLAKIDAGGAAAESDENNNVAISNQLQVTPPPPDIFWNSLSGPDVAVAPGADIAISRSYEISSAPISPDFGVQYRLSPNRIWGDQDDILLGEETIIAGDGKSVGQHDGQYAATAPAAAPTGSYYLLGKVDFGEAAGESNENNNVLVGNQIQLAQPVQGPQVNSPGLQTIRKNKKLLFKTFKALARVISISDPAAGDNTVQVTLTADHGLISLGKPARALRKLGLIFSSGDGKKDVVAAFTAPLSVVNLALYGLSFVPTRKYVGSAGIRIDVGDLGHGGGGSLTDTDNVLITVTP